MNGRFCSRKMSRATPWESSNELAFLILAEIDPTITSVYAQSLKVALPMEGGPRWHVPDFVVARQTGVEIHEVKPDDKAALPEVQAVAAAAELYFCARGATYWLSLASVLKLEPRLSRVKTVLRRLHAPVPTRTSLAMLAYCQDNDSSTIRDLLASTKTWDSTFEQVMTLCGIQKLQIDLLHPISLDSHISVAGISTPAISVLPGPALRCQA